MRRHLARGFLDGYLVSLVRGSDLIEFSLPRFRGKSVQVAVGGDWDHLELIRLAGCFALLSLRRGDAYRSTAVVGAIGPHAR
ncbi:hypothetical protein QF035_002695 [Streptomyces umbrinus]|uniref:Uncharacterized protein n=1 Tax=Streptomyces umbrinus TaxID=67370 RepID=A0ABU0SNI9_9ACTN|nr:hypothetical protein [Streptomyces umbrinus]MDQ1025113.1 hypothetical protein [Streptomyces umbrinus]